MFEVFFEPVTDDEKEYCHALWLLSGLVLREKPPITGELEEEYKEARKEIQEIRERLKRTQVFQSLTPKQQKRILEGKRQRDWERLARNAGFGERTIRQIYGYLSSYAHADGLSGIQLITAKTQNEQIKFIETQMTITMMILSKMILDYMNRFTESDKMAKAHPKALSIAKFWSKIVEDVP